MLTSVTTAAMTRRMLPPSLTFPLLHQIPFKYHEIVRVARIPPNAHDVITQRDRKMNELALMVQALAADVLIPVVLRPGMLRLSELTPDAVLPHVRQNSAEPVIEHAGLQFEADPEPHRLVVHARDQRQ